MAKQIAQQYVFFENTVYIQTALNKLPNGAAIFFEFRHWKAKKQKVGCWHTRCKPTLRLLGQYVCPAVRPVEMAWLGLKLIVLQWPLGLQLRSRCSLALLFWLRFQPCRPWFASSRASYTGLPPPVRLHVLVHLQHTHRHCSCS